MHVLLPQDLRSSGHNFKTVSPHEDGVSVRPDVARHPEARRARLGDVEADVAESGQVRLEEGEVVNLLQPDNVRVPLHDLFQQSGRYQFNGFNF